MKTLAFAFLVSALVAPIAICAGEKYSNPQTAKETTFVAYPKDFTAQAENFLGENRVAWRGERVIARLAVNNIPANSKLSARLLPTGTKSNSREIPARAEYVRATIGQGRKPIPDIVEPTGTQFKIPAGSGIVLVSCDIPADAEPGEYELSAKVGGKTVHVAKIKVLPITLPPPRDWRVHLDLWQHPEAVARWTGTQLWSKKHFAAMKPIMRRLADAGQKAITCSIVEEPWEHQTFDDWSSMVKWTKARNGNWKFDYSAFDKYVEFMMNEVGITEQISCYTMVSWTNKTKYFDEAKGEFKTISLDPTDPASEPVWEAFLTDFRKHVREKGWLDKTCIALDERPDKLMRAARKLLQKYAPEMKIVSAVNFPGTSEGAMVYDLSPIFNHADPKVARERKKMSTPTKTTFYVCLSPEHPNTFPHSPAAEPHWIGLFAAAGDFDGFLRWAYNSWVENPFASCVWEKKNWPAGDCFLVYPGNRTTLRFESLRDGIEDFEKIRILREKSKKRGASKELQNSVARLDEYLSTEFTVNAGLNGANDHAGQVKRARELIDAASKLAK